MKGSKPTRKDKKDIPTKKRGYRLTAELTLPEKKKLRKYLANKDININTWVKKKIEELPE